jgi:phenylpyruvate tautomerase PptA (4-oxalocrotonate tautomerase family)
MIHIVVTVKMAQDHISKGMTPEIIAAITAWIVEFFAGGDVAC